MTVIPYAGVNGPLMARATARGAGFPRAGAGKILPRPRRTVGAEKAGRPEPYAGVRGGSPALQLHFPSDP